jgi:hypothetical protein
VCRVTESGDLLKQARKTIRRQAVGLGGLRIIALKHERILPVYHIRSMLPECSIGRELVA